jgi:hypothetical protein
METIYKFLLLSSESFSSSGKFVIPAQSSTQRTMIWKVFQFFLKFRIGVKSLGYYKTLTKAKLPDF